MKKQPEVTARTRQKLVDAFWKAYERKPLESITVRELTDAAGYNRGTFYQYFRDVYALRDAEVQDMLTDIQEIPFQAVIRDVGAFLGVVLKLYDTHADRMCILIDRGDPVFDEGIRTELFRSMREGFGKNESIETQLIQTYAFRGMASALSLWHRNKPEGATKEDFISIMYGVMSRGVVPMMEEKI